MTKLLILLVVFSATAFAGVGGRGGGSSNSDSIDNIGVHFQKESTWVNARLNRSLCHTSSHYEAVVSRCVQWSQGNKDVCLKTSKVRITQPIESRRRVCKQRSGRGCREVDYIQDPERTVEVVDERGHLVEVQYLAIPRCR